MPAQYSELVSILEPRTLTSISMDEPGAIVDQLKGFLTFTPEQVANFDITVDSKGSIKTPAHQKQTPLQENDPSQDTPRRAPLKRHANKKRPPVRKMGRNERIHRLRQKVEMILAQKKEPGSQRFLHLFRLADKNFRGYLNHAEFRGLLGEGGMGLRLKRKEEDLLIAEIDDGHGAIEAKNFTEFLARNYMPVSDAMEDAQLTAAYTMKQRIEGAAKSRPTGGNGRSRSSPSWLRWSASRHRREHRRRPAGGERSRRGLGGAATLQNPRTSQLQGKTMPVAGMPATSLGRMTRSTPNRTDRQLSAADGQRRQDRASRGSRLGHIMSTRPRREACRSRR